MIANMISSRFGISFNPRYLCALLGRTGLSFQKAKFFSDKAGEEEYECARNEWKEKTWPSILEKEKEKNAVISPPSFSIAINLNIQYRTRNVQ